MKNRMIFAIVIACYMLFLIILNNPFSGDLLSDSDYTCKSAKEAVLDNNKGITINPVGTVELKDCELYLWTDEDNMLKISQVLCNKDHTRFEESADSAFIDDYSIFDQKNDRKLKWDKIGYDTPVAYTLAPQSMDSAAYKGKKAQYKDFHLTDKGNKTIQFRLFYVDTSADSAQGKNGFLDAFIDYTFFTVEILCLVLSLFFANLCRKLYALYDNCDPAKYTKINRRRDSKRNYRHNLNVDYITEFYLGDFDACISHAKEYLACPGTKQTWGAYSFLCAALFLQGQYADCLAAMEEAERNWKKSKPFPLTADFKYMRSYIDTQYKDAITCMANTLYGKTTQIKKARIYYFIGLVYGQLNDRKEQARYMHKILKLDSKTYFAQRARQIMEEYRQNYSVPGEANE